MSSSFSTRKPVGLGEVIKTTEQASQIQQVKSVGNQPRTGVLSPNVITATNPKAISQPSHVQNVRALVSPANDATSRVTVTFSRDPNDPFFSGALVHVSGYKGNPAKVQVASGQSPISFALENTGEPVSVSVQANGGLGPAPINTAPNATLQLRSTPLATVTTVGGLGPPQPPDNDTGGMNGPKSWWKSGDGSPYVWTPNSGSWGYSNTNNGKIFWWMFQLQFPFTYFRLSYRQSGSGRTGCLGGAGIYDVTGQTKLISWNGIDQHAGTFNMTVTTTAVTLQPGTYICAIGCDGGTGSAATTDSGYSTSGSSDVTESWNEGGFIRSGGCTNATSAGVMPASLGTLATETNLPANGLPDFTVSNN